MSSSDLDHTERKQLADRLRKSREYLKLSQDEVAQKLELPRTAITGIETAQRKVEAVELKKLSELYQQPIAYFTGQIEVEAPLTAEIAHLARKVADLSQSDREELERFAEYLLARNVLKGKE